MLDCGVSSPTWLAIIWSMLIERWFGWGLSYLSPKLSICPRNFPETFELSVPETFPETFPRNFPETFPNPATLPGCLLKANKRRKF
jgi:hypothetical protein